MRTRRLCLVVIVTSVLRASTAAAAPSLDQCISAVAGGLLRFVQAKGTCVRTCEDAVRRGKLAADTQCLPPSSDSRTETCLLRAEERFTGSGSSARKLCKNNDVALFYGGTSTCFFQNETVNDLLQCLQDEAESAVDSITQQVYHPQRPPVCGDGIISPGEGCDPRAFPDGCEFGEVCNPNFCFCTFQGCGNGIIEFGEDCDPNAFPSGCSFNEFCDSECKCEGGYGSPSGAFLDPPTKNLLE